MPRNFTPSHPRAVRSLFDEEQQAWVRDVMKIDLRPWQHAVLVRAFEVDADGLLVWRVVIVSVGRQSGKTWLIRALTSLRQRLFATVETQQILHVARVRDAARSVIVNEQFARWAKGHGIVVRSSNGQEQWKWPDDSTWDLSSLDGAYGRSAGLVLLDETWDISRRQYFEGVQPVTAAREQAQTWFFSAAHREATELVPMMIERALSGREGYFIADWGALPGEDVTDRAVWQRMGPHWDRNREIAVEEAAGEESFAEQWANVWPDVLGRAITKSSFANWGSLGRVETPDPPYGAIVALDERYDGSGASVGAFYEGSYWYREVNNVQEAVTLAQKWTSGEVLVGISLRHTVTQMGIAHPVAYGAKETNLGLPHLIEAVKNGSIRHEHDEILALQAMGAKVNTSDAGVMSLSVKGSTHGVLGLKLAAWLNLHARNQVHEMAAVW